MMFNSNLSEPFREGFIQNIHIALTSVAHSLLGHHSSKVTFTSCTVLAAVYITSYQHVYGLRYFISTCVRFILLHTNVCTVYITSYQRVCGLYYIMDMTR